jgi:hypothetical protein
MNLEGNRNIQSIAYLNAHAKSGMAQSCGKCSFTFYEVLKLSPEVAAPFCCPTSSAGTLQFLHLLTKTMWKHLAIQRCEVESHHGFNFAVA